MDAGTATSSGSCFLQSRASAPRRDEYEVMQALSAKQELRRAFRHIEQELPTRMAAALRWLRHPRSRLIRIPAGIALIAGGVFSFLPLLGLWMLPLGLLLLAADVPFLQRPMARFALWCVRALNRFRAWRKRD